MNRMRGYSNLGARGDAPDDAARERTLRALAERAQPRGRARLRLTPGCASNLRRLLAEAERLDDAGDEALKRLRADAGRVESCLRQARAESGAQTVAAQGGPRVLLLARALAGGGERLLTRERLMREAALFDSARSLEMREMQLIPAALRIALCEALASAAADVLRVARARAAADAWVRAGGGSRARGDCDEAFFERALQLSAELEQPELHARVERAIERCGQRREWLVERAHRIAADNCLRLDNLMKLKHLLDSLNWRRCFEALCPAELELRDDPGKVYPRMDAASRALARDAVEELARRAGAEEILVVRRALIAARRALEAFGADDPRAGVCWYLLEDAGRAALCRELGAKKPRRRVPDPSGRGSALLVGALCALLLALILWGIGAPPLMLYALPLAWVSAWRLLGRVYPRFVRPRTLPKLRLDSVPDGARTLVALPVLLSGEARAREMVGRMETLGCLERDENIDFLLLGDFRDGESPHEIEDEAILRAAREGVAALNESTGRERYFYLHRERRLRVRDGRWMGENRKRGALVALNRLLLGREGAADAFGAEGARAEALIGRYRYVVTLDADTEYLPGTLQKLIGAMLHPLNRSETRDGARRGYAVLQPDMRLTAEAAGNAYVALSAGRGGVDGYPTSVSDFYQDMTGRGCFAGKGIYDVRAFAEATEGALGDDILSHDMIEGILAGAGVLSDVRFYDGCPAELGAELQRLHRWTRGDWQLLPLLGGRLRLGAADRMKIAGNLLRSLYAPALLGLLIHAVWIDAPGAFALGLLLAFLDPILNLIFNRGRDGRRAWRAALLQLSTLPATAACQLDAILRTLWRLAVSHRHLMEWVTAADARGRDGRARLWGRVAALLALPGLLRGQWIVPVLGVAALFWVGADWAGDLSRQSAGASKPLKPGQAALLGELAQRTWRFFETYVPEGGPGLPPDNVQLDPDLGPAMRTSPTNVGLYLMSCLAARELGLLAEGGLRARVAATAGTLERLEKWNGQLYNWYDLESLAPLKPRYVSAVDSGNLAGALLLCAHALRRDDPALSARLRALAEGMDLAALYDGERELFRIGADVEGGRLSESHYDLYASEARILSFAAMMLGQVPARHWSRLNRAAVRLGRGCALLSWSGTMFEYLMPELLLRSPANSLAGQSREGVAACQIRHGRALGRPWGVSESGYYAFDRQLNYQYRAFGLRKLALSGEAEDGVVAPYAAALALCCAPGAAAENLRRMCALGWSGELGLYEAADYDRAEEDGAPRIVRSHMAHHQGMALCAICNALRNDVLARRFMDIPEARALRLLLQEKPVERPPRRAHARPAAPRRAAARPEAGYDRAGRAGSCAADAHLLSGAGTTALVTARGAAFAWSEGLQLNRFSGDLTNPHEGMYVHLEDAETGACTVIGQSGRASFGAGAARFREEFAGLRVELKLAVSPEDGALYQALEIENPGGAARELNVTGCLAAALAPERDMRAHPAFQNLFVEGEIHGARTLALRRRPRTPGEEQPELLYLVSGGEAPRGEMRLDALLGRSGSLGMPGGLNREFAGGAGALLNPCAALRVRVRLEPEGAERLHFALLLSPGGERAERAARALDRDAAARALRLAEAQARTALGHAGIDGARHALYQRCAALLFDAKLRAGVNGGAEACEAWDRRALWSAGVSGELPVLLVELEGDDLSCVREGVRLHAFYQSMGVRADLVLLDGRGGGYRRNAGGELGGLIAASHLSGQLDRPGGAHILEARGAEAAAASLRRAAALRLRSGAAPLGQLRDALDALAPRPGEAYLPMPAEPLPAPEGLECFNGFGGFRDGEYHIALRGGQLPPAPWCNVIASERAGAVLSERGGGFAWFGNSRDGRLTPFTNDALREGWGWMFYLADARERTYLRLLPGDAPMTDFDVRYAPGVCSYAGRARGVRFELRARAVGDGLLFEIELRNAAERALEAELVGFVDWLMGVDAADAAALRTWSRFGACFASGAAPGVGVFAADDPAAATGCDRLTLFSGGDAMRPRGLDRLGVARGGWTLHLPVKLAAGEVQRARFLLGCAPDVAAACALARELRAGAELSGGTDWPELLGALAVETPDAKLNFLANAFLPTQALNARVRGRTGLYQPGGAYGFRDQLQDMMALMHCDPGRARRHLLRCAARQFEAGDVLHWWHEPYTGVRTRVSDDLLFLPWATARYVELTGDAGVLNDSAPYLEDVEIPAGAEDIYAEMRPSPRCGTLHEHCMRALRCAAQLGARGLCRMGGGDWNDGMNRVGGESVWLSEFLAAVAAEYARVAPDEGDRAWLTALNERLCAALEASAWDGEWYLRAFAEDGTKLGGRESPACRIDLISQAWAVLAGLDPARCACAMDAAWEHLADERLKLIRLLDPPFDGDAFDPGYIAAYPPGIRENGAQYTHAACWFLLALVRRGDAARAHRVLQMLLPLNHALDRRAAEVYRVEPYVMAADVYANPDFAGRGGWTWYTGSAGWMLQAILELLGYERRGARVRLRALLGDWPEAAVAVRFGSSRYRLVCRREVERISLDGADVEGEFIEMVDDGREHLAAFPPRRPGDRENITEKNLNGWESVL